MHACRCLIALPAPQVLSHDAVARLLLVVHQQLDRACHPRHQAQALTPLQVGIRGHPGRYADLQVALGCCCDFTYCMKSLNCLYRCSMPC